MSARQRKPTVEARIERKETTPMTAHKTSPLIGHVQLAPRRAARGRQVAVLAALAAGLLWLAPATASALTIHAFSSSFASQGSGAGQVSLTATGSSTAGSELAVNTATGDVYVADTGNARVDEFTASGAFVRAWGWGVADGASQFETCTTTCQAGIAGSSPGQFTTPALIAVDNSTGPSAGDVYVGDQTGATVTKFDANGNLVSSWGDAAPADGQLSGKSTTHGSFAFLEGISVDGAGNLWVYDGLGNMSEYGQGGSFATEWNAGRSPYPPAGIAVDSLDSLYAVNSGGIDKFTSAGTELGFVEFGAYTPTGLTVDPSANDLYVDDGSQIHHYTSACDPTAGHCTENDSFGPGHLSGSAAGVAVDAATRTVYVADAGSGQIATFGAETLPDVATAQPSSVSQTGAILSGTVNPDGVQISDCHFEYGTDTSYGQSVPCAQSPAQIGTGNSPVQVSANVSGLQVGTGYHFRLDAGNANGGNQGGDVFFPTLGPGFGVKSFTFGAVDQSGGAYSQAGGHPYALNTDLRFNTTTDQNDNVSPDENAKDVRVDLPAGLIGNPTGIPQCPQSDLVLSAHTSACPPSSQVGVITLYLQGGGTVQSEGPLPVYNMVPPDNLPAQFGFDLVGYSTFIDSNVRTGGDYGITSSVANITTDEPVIGTDLSLWGVPADPSHDSERACPGQDPPFVSGVTCSAGSPLVPLLTMPTSCPGSQLTANVSADSWQHAGTFVSASSNSPATTGCGALPFDPTISVQPDTTVADSPSGLSVDLRVPQDGLTDPAGLAEADLKKAVVTLPQGVSVNPASANGLAACTTAQIGIDNANAPACPDASKIGSVEVDTPLLPNPLKGGVYVAQQDNNPFNSLLAIYVTAEDPVSGVLVKLAGHVIADPATGQLQTVFDNNPQLPFSEFKLDFWGGPQAVLATPETCGTFSSSADLSPWSGGAGAVSSDPFTISSGCVSGFSPTFTAGTQNPQAGGYSPFVLSFFRSDTDQNLSGLTVKLPPGLVAKLAGVSLCSDAQLAQAAAKTGTAEQASPSCPANSLVGTVTTGAGVGPDPFFLSGKAYLTGPYKGAPYGLAVVVPALAGPYDLGTVVVRQALHIDPTTAQVTAVSDPFPTILQGIPLRLRRVDVNLNRPDFIVNPTSCDVMAIGGTLSSTLGINDPVSSRFQVGGCASLGFSPKLRMKLTGRGRTKSGDHPNLISTLTQRGGQANIHNVRVALPLSLALDPNNSQHVCPYATAQAVTTGPANCPASTLVGHATAITPLLSQPLSGPVYLVQGIRMQNGVQIHTLPSLLIPLRGQIALDLRAQSSVSGGKLVTTFPVIPDAAVSKFTLQINGGRKGILVITGRGRTICGSPQVTQANLIAQNGKAEYPNVKMGTPCRAHHKRHSRRHHSRRRHG